MKKQPIVKSAGKNGITIIFPRDKKGYDQESERKRNPDLNSNDSRYNRIATNEVLNSIEENKDEKRKKNEMQRNILERLLKKNKFQVIEIYSKFGNNYYKELDKYKKANIQAMHLDDIIQTIIKSGKTQKFLDSMNNIEIDKIHKSELHGIAHNERTSLLGLAIGILEGLNDRDLELLIEATKYHDIGRLDEEEGDQAHGTISSELIEKVDIKLSEEEMKMIKTIFICHSMDDEKFDKVAEKLEIQDIERCRKIFEILKDADGLDRIRLLDNGYSEMDALNTNFLRTTTAKKMVAAAYELYYNYKYLEKDQTKKPEDGNEIDIPN